LRPFPSSKVVGSKVPSTVPVKPIRRFERSQSVRRNDFGKFGPALQKKKDMKRDPQQPSNTTYMNFRPPSSTLPPVLEDEEDDDNEIDADMLPQPGKLCLPLKKKTENFFLFFFVLFSTHKPFVD